MKEKTKRKPREEPDKLCEVCGQKLTPWRSITHECSHPECPNRHTITAAPPEDSDLYMEEGCGKTPARRGHE